MSASPLITRVELSSFTIRVPHIGTDRAGAGVRYQPGDGDEQLRLALRVHTDAGIAGEYVPPRGRVKVVMSAAAFLAHKLIGQRALERERIYRSLRLATKHVGEIGIGALDIALWDIAGKLHDQPVYRLLGGHRERLPAYASTLHGDAHDDGLCDPGAYADYAERCTPTTTSQKCPPTPLTSKWNSFHKLAYVTGSPVNESTQ